MQHFKFKCKKKKKKKKKYTLYIYTSNISFVLEFLNQLHVFQ